MFLILYFFKFQIKKIIPSTVTIIDSGDAVARQTQKLLKDLNGLKSKASGNAQIFSNADITVMTQLVGTTQNVHFKEF